MYAIAREHGNESAAERQSSRGYNGGDRMRVEAECTEPFMVSMR
jgi:hypothetical protein